MVVRRLAVLAGLPALAATAVIGVGTGTDNAQAVPSQARLALVAGAEVADALPLEQNPVRANRETRATYLKLWNRGQRLDIQTGRNIVANGVREDSVTRRATRPEVRSAVLKLRKDVSRAERKRAKQRKRAAAARAAKRAGAPAASGSAKTAKSGGSGSAPSGALQRIAQCESGGNPGAIGGGGAYRGKYQFDRGTWATVGGSGDPAAASEAEQDRRAAALYARTGGSSWPNC
ncbi:MAG: transglycosylase family protein [Solirubrobacterales bacterium]